jgi:YegS/Rv2252/BmrU family lipid kinase
VARKGKQERGGDDLSARSGDALAAAAARLAGLVADTERDEERRAGRLAGAGRGGAGGERGPGHRRRRALLIINTKSGPAHDSIAHVRDVVELLAGQGITVDVRIKLRKRQARDEARRAARAGVPLIVAAGGDGTIEAVAAGLVGTEAVLGIVPLGTYNNVAACLGLPFDPAEACALIGAGPVRRIDVGRVTARGKKRPRLFIEMAAAGVTAALMPAGQEAKKGAWDAAAQTLPEAVGMRPTPAVLRLDGESAERQAHTVLIEVANAPLMGPAFQVAPHARMDDALLDVAIYHDVTPAGLAARLVALKAGVEADDERIERARTRRLDLRTAAPLPVMADSRVIGTTPARFEVLPGALRVIAGHGPGLAHPVSEALLEAAVSRAHPPSAAAPAEPPADAVAVPAPATAGVAAVAAAAVAPAVGKVLAVASRARALAGPAALLAGGVLAGVAALPVARTFGRNGSRR